MKQVIDCTNKKIFSKINDSEAKAVMFCLQRLSKNSYMVLRHDSFAAVYAITDGDPV